MKLKKAATMLPSCALPMSAQAQASGDAAAGESNFRQCASCHGVASPDGDVIHRVAADRPEPLGRSAGRVAGGHMTATAVIPAPCKAAGEAGIT